MIVGILGTLLLLVVALLGRWSRSTELKTGRSIELARTQLAAKDPGHAKMLVTGLVVLLVWMVGAHFWLPLPLAFLNTTSAQVTAFCVEHLHQSRPVPGEYILIIEGSSVTSRGVDGAAPKRWKCEQNVERRKNEDDNPNEIPSSNLFCHA